MDLKAKFLILSTYLNFFLSFLALTVLGLNNNLPHLYRQTIYRYQNNRGRAIGLPFMAEANTKRFFLIIN